MCDHPFVFFLIVEITYGKYLNFVIWNCRGLQRFEKVKQVMTTLADMDSKIVFLQETHLIEEDEKRVRRRWHGNVFTAAFSSRSRGVMTFMYTILLKTKR